MTAVALSLTNDVGNGPAGREVHVRGRIDVAGSYAITGLVEGCPMTAEDTGAGLMALVVGRAVAEVKSVRFDPILVNADAAEALCTFEVASVTVAAGVLTIVLHFLSTAFSATKIVSTLTDPVNGVKVYFDLVLKLAA